MTDPLRAAAEAVLAAEAKGGASGYYRGRWYAAIDALRVALAADTAPRYSEADRQARAVIAEAVTADLNVDLEVEYYQQRGFGPGVPTMTKPLATDTAPLDAERLALATARVVGWDGPLDYHREWAQKVAAEYVRLAKERDQG